MQVRAGEVEIALVQPVQAEREEGGAGESIQCFADGGVGCREELSGGEGRGGGDGKAVHLPMLHMIYRVWFA